MNCDFNCRNGLIDPKSIYQDPKMISVAFEIIKICKKYFSWQTPTSKIVFWAALPHFSTNFIKKGDKLFRRSYCIQIRAALRNLNHHTFIAHLYSQNFTPVQSVQINTGAVGLCWICLENAPLRMNIISIIKLQSHTLDIDFTSIVSTIVEGDCFYEPV